MYSLSGTATNARPPPSPPPPLPPATGDGTGGHADSQGPIRNVFATSHVTVNLLLSAASQNLYEWGLLAGRATIWMRRDIREWFVRGCEKFLSALAQLLCLGAA